MTSWFMLWNLQANINVRAIAQGCSEYNITVVLKREDCIRALRAVHSRFYLSRTTIAMGIIGPGLIGSTLLDQLRDQVLSFAGFFLCCYHFMRFVLRVFSFPAFTFPLFHVIFSSFSSGYLILFLCNWFNNQLKEFFL